MFLKKKKKKEKRKKKIKTKRKLPPCYYSSPEHESAQGFMSSSSQLVEATCEITVHFALQCPLLFFRLDATKTQHGGLGRRAGQVQNEC